MFLTKYLHCIVHCSWKVELVAPQGEGKLRSDQSDNIEFNFCGVSFVSSTLFYFMVYFVQVHNPLRLLLVLSCVLLLTCLAARFTCEPNLEDHLSNEDKDVDESKQQSQDFKSSPTSINSSLTSNTTSCDSCFLLNTIKNDSTQQVCGFCILDH